MNHSTTANGSDPGLEISTQAVEAEIRDRADPAQVLADRVAQLYRQMPIAIGATFIAGGIATFELQGARLFGSKAGASTVLSAERLAVPTASRNPSATSP